MLAPTTYAEASRPLVSDGFCRVSAADARAMLGAAACDDLADFARSWDRLGDDRYMADGGRYRRRRHAIFEASEAAILRKPQQPHYQSRDYNILNGGIERWFEPIEPAIAESAMMQSVIALGHAIFTPLSAQVARWHVEAHQFRIEAGTGQPGLPTPEGLHRDGVDWVIVMLISRRNVAEGITKIHALDGREIGAFCLQAPLDLALVDDHRVFHAVTPIVPIDPGQPACRDVLVVTYKAA